MKVSVIIPTYNRATVVGEAIESVLAQSYQEFEIIIVDDGSTDETAETIKPFLDDPRVNYIRQENAGVSAARNAGVRAASGEIVSFLDSDDLWKPGKLEYEVAFLSSNPQVQVVFTDTEVLEGDRKIASWTMTMPVLSMMLAGSPDLESLVIPQREMFLYLLEEFPVKGCNFTLWRETFQRAGGFNETYPAVEDWEFFLRLAGSENFAHIRRTLILARDVGDSLNRAEKEKSILRMLALLSNTRKLMGRDPQVALAIKRGIVTLSKSLNWYYLERGQSVAAARTCLGGYWKTRNSEFLLRAVAVIIPRSVRHKIKNPYSA